MPRHFFARATTSLSLLTTALLLTVGGAGLRQVALPVGEANAADTKAADAKAADAKAAKAKADQARAERIKAEKAKAAAAKAEKAKADKIAAEKTAAEERLRPWPPELKGAQNGTVTFTSDELLVVPADVKAEAEKEGAAKFVVAKKAPTIDLAFHGNLGTFPFARRLWSSWGDICVARDGRVYVAIGDHGDDVGGDARCFLYRWDPKSKRLEQVVDMNQVVPPKAGRPSWSKVHAKLDEGADGKIYFSCTLNDGNRASLPTHHWDDELPGGQVYHFDPATGKTAVFTSLPPKRCTATSAIDAKRNIWWCNLEAGEGNALFGLDLATKKPVYQGKDGSHGFNRAFALMNDGSIYYNGPENLETKATRLMKLDGKTYEITATNSTFVDSPGMRTASPQLKDGSFYGVTQKTSELFRYSTASDELKMLGKSFLTGAYTTVMVASPDERYLYYLPGAHGGAFKHGTPIVRYDREKNVREVLAFLAPYCEKTYGYVPAGTYGMKLSADGKTLYVNFNGHAIEGVRPAKRRADGFGLTSFAAIHLAE
jgi:DNA-binding beta-propeller fold protein YncE